VVGIWVLAFTFLISLSLPVSDGARL